MVMKKKIISKVLICAVVLLLLYPIVMEAISNNSIATIKYKDFSSKVKDTVNYKMSVIYASSSENAETKDINDELKTIIKEDLKDIEGIEALYLDTSKMTYEEISELGIDPSANNSYIFAFNGEIIKSVNDKDTDFAKVKKYLNEYAINGIDDEVTAYKVAKDADAFAKIVKSKNITMTVFGRNNCYYCNRFLPVYNTVAEEYGLDIYYFDSNTYNPDEYAKVMKSGLSIPAACTDSGEAEPLENGFATPLTLFTKKGKVIDCISGYVNKSTLITKLETLGLITTEEE